MGQAGTTTGWWVTRFVTRSDTRRKRGMRSGKRFRTVGRGVCVVRVKEGGGL